MFAVLMPFASSPHHGSRSTVALPLAMKDTFMTWTSICFIISYQVSGPSLHADLLRDVKLLELNDKCCLLYIISKKLDPFLTQFY